MSIDFNDQGVIDMNIYWVSEVTLREVSRKAREKFGIKGGAYVYKTTNKEWYDKLGLQNGYIITHINDEPINSIVDILEFKKEYSKDGIENNLHKIGVINRRGQKERFIFK